MVVVFVLFLSFTPLFPPLLHPSFAALVSVSVSVSVVDKLIKASQTLAVVVEVTPKYKSSTRTLL